MTPSPRRVKFIAAVAVGVFLLSCATGMWRVHAEGARTRYPRMAPIQRYLMDRTAEIALARSAAPASISRDATVLVLGRHGYETAVAGTNGFVCDVERGWVGAFDWSNRFNPRIRGADCLNPPAARSILPIEELRTKLVLAGRSRKVIIDRVRAVLHTGEVPALEPGAMSYMMGKGSYLTDQGRHNLPHLMFFVPLANAAVWGAGLPGSPVGSVSFWFISHASAQELKGFPPLRIFTVRVGEWSDGTAAP